MKKTILLTCIFCFVLSSCHLLVKRKHPSRVDSMQDLQEYLLYGWNTWNNSNVLNYVLMPEGLSLKLTFRETVRQKGMPCFPDKSCVPGSENQDFKIKTGDHAYDISYSEMEIEWKGLTALIQTATHGENLYILYTPVKLPEYPPIMILETGMLWNKEGNIEKKDDFIQVDLGTKSFGIDATLEDSLLPLPVTSPYISCRSDTITAFYTGKKRSLEYIFRFVNTRKNQFLSTRERYQDYPDAYGAMQTVLAWNNIYDPFNKRVITPVNRQLNEKWGGWILQNWDSYFTALMYAMENKFLAFSNAISITNEIEPAGYLPLYSAALSNGKSENFSQPPVGSLIIKLIYDKYPEKWFLEEVYDNLLACNRWWHNQKANNGYFLQYNESGNSVIKDLTGGKTRFSPSAISLSDKKTVPVSNSYTGERRYKSVGLMSLYIADCKSLAEIANILNKKDDVAELSDREAEYSEKLKELWDENDGIYKDRDLSSGEWSEILTPANFFPLLTDVPSARETERMIQEHLMNPEEFYGNYLLPEWVKIPGLLNDSIAVSENIDASLNFLVYLGLKKNNLLKAAAALSDKSYRMMINQWNENRTLPWNYSTHTGTGSREDHECCNTTGGLLALIKLMQEGFWEQDLSFEKYY